MDVTSAGLVARTVRARREPVRVDVVRLLLTVLALVPYMLGWAAGGVVTVCAWTWAALVAGWRDARRRGESSG